MKARIKATGEIAEFSTGKNLQGETILLKVGTASIFLLNEVEPIHDIDWQQARIQASIAAMNIVKGAYNVHDDMERLVRHSVKLADALIAELQKKGGQDD